MVTIDEYLKKYNVTYDDLEDDEIATLNAQFEVMSASAMTVDKIREFVNNMLATVQIEISKHDLTDKEDMYLKARLRNLTLLAAFITSPEKAKAHLEKMLSNVAKPIG